MYEEMNTDMGDSMDEEAPASEQAEADGLDEEFRMHAEKAGMDTPEKMEAFKLAIERCVGLQQEKSYAADSGDLADTGETDEDAEI